MGSERLAAGDLALGAQDVDRGAVIVPGLEDFRETELFTFRRAAIRGPRFPTRFEWLQSPPRFVLWMSTGAYVRVSALGSFLSASMTTREPLSDAVETRDGTWTVPAFSNVVAVLNELPKKSRLVRTFSLPSSE